MRIAVVVPGRFHAFYYASALLRRGHEVTVFTNYPAMVAGRWGLPPRHVRGFPVHGAAVRLAGHARRHVSFGAAGHWALPVFTRWAARHVAREEWDVVHSYSGASLELLRSGAGGRALTLLRRSSAHIAHQKAILDAEVARTGLAIERPDDWIVTREMQEYELADHVVVPSTFARQSFVSHGYPEQKLVLLPMAPDSPLSRSTPDTVGARRQRILRGEPLRVLYVGSLSPRKGIWDLSDVVRNIETNRFSFTFVGDEPPGVRPLIADLKGRTDCRFVGHRPSAELPRWYAEADLFVFPTLEDGFAVTLAQATAAGLPVVASTNCSGPDLITEGDTGWLVPPRDPKQILDALDWADGHRVELADMCERVAASSMETRTWDDFAVEFEAFVDAAKSAKTSESAKSHGHAGERADATRRGR